MNENGTIDEVMIEFQSNDDQIIKAQPLAHPSVCTFHTLRFTYHASYC
jgi:hypothetical protein